MTLEHARRIQRSPQVNGGRGALPAKGPVVIITEIDGTMLPVVQTGAGEGRSGRKNRTCQWKETRLCAARVKGQTRCCYGVSDAGVQDAGYLWAHTAAMAGWSINTYLHTVADGALWIHRQALMHLGKNGSFLLDFFHVCEYLAAAAKNPKTGEQWLELQKKRLKDGRQKEVLQALLAFVEPDDVPDEQAPARQAHRYLQNRIDQLDYKSAIENDLPIGSGMIEGAHRHVLQKRIKISAAWWREDNLLAMAHLRVCRANQLENSYWLDMPKAA